MNELILVLENIRSTHNVGSILRSAECFGLKQIYFTGYTPYPIIENDNRLPHIAAKLDRQISKTALGAEKLVECIIAEIKPTLEYFKNQGYSIAALEQDENSENLKNYQLIKPTVLVLGNELDGVSGWTKSYCDVILEIKQYGHKESLNVANAAAIAMYQLHG